MAQMQTAIKTAPATEPLTTAEAKLHLRVTHSSDDTPIDELVAAARGIFERRTGRACISQTWYLYLDDWPATEIQLPYPPATAVTSIKYNDSAGAQQTWSDTEYDVDYASEPARIVCAYGESWPSARVESHSIVVEYICGWANAAAVPEDVRSALKMLVKQGYDQRDGIARGATERSIKAMTASAEAILSLYYTAEPINS